MAIRLRLLANNRVAFRETFDRNGPGMRIANRTGFVNAINGLVNEGDTAEVGGQFVREDDVTNEPIAIFKNEPDADAFLAMKGAGHHKDKEEGGADNFTWKIVNG